MAIQEDAADLSDLPLGSRTSKGGPAMRPKRADDEELVGEGSMGRTC